MYIYIYIICINHCCQIDAQRRTVAAFLRRGPFALFGASAMSSADQASTAETSWQPRQSLSSTLKSIIERDNTTNMSSTVALM